MCAAEGRQWLQEEEEVDKKWKTRKPCGFQVKQHLCPRTQRGADKSYNAPERGGEPWSCRPERFQRFPLRRQKPRRQLCMCYSNDCGYMWCDCSATSKMFCDVNPIWPFDESILFYRAMQTAKQMQLLQVSLTAVTPKPRECIRPKRKDYFSLKKKTLGFHWFCLASDIS